MIQIIIFGIADILVIINLIREIIVLKSIKSKFICTNCKTFNKEISQNHNCEMCRRRFNVHTETWEHLLIHRVNWMQAKDKNRVYKWKEYKILSIIEIALTILMIITFSLVVSMNLYNILH